MTQQTYDTSQENAKPGQPAIDAILSTILRQREGFWKVFHSILPDTGNFEYILKMLSWDRTMIFYMEWSKRTPKSTDLPCPLILHTNARRGCKIKVIFKGECGGSRHNGALHAQGHEGGGVAYMNLGHEDHCLKTTDGFWVDPHALCRFPPVDILWFNATRVAVEYMHEGRKVIQTLILSEWLPDEPSCGGPVRTGTAKLAAS